MEQALNDLSLSTRDEKTIEFLNCKACGSLCFDKNVSCSIFNEFSKFIGFNLFPIEKPP
jgi:hypothetical protein